MHASLLSILEGVDSELGHCVQRGAQKPLEVLRRVIVTSALPASFSSLSPFNPVHEAAVQHSIFTFPEGAPPQLSGKLNFL